MRAGDLAHHRERIGRMPVKDIVSLLRQDQQGTDYANNPTEQNFSKPRDRDVERSVARRDRQNNEPRRDRSQAESQIGGSERRHGRDR